MRLFVCDLLVRLSTTKLSLLSGLEPAVWIQPVALVVRVVREAKVWINKK